MSVHSWCSDPARDEAVRAAEDNRQWPLPTLEEAIADPFAKAATICESESAVEPVIHAADAHGGGGGGLRTERVTLRERTPGEAAAYAQGMAATVVADLIRERDAALRERDAAREECESLRAERDDALLVLPACCGRLSDAAATVVQERDAALRERDAHKEEYRKLRAEQITQELTADRFAAAVAEADRLRARVSELESSSKAAPAANAGGGSKQEPLAWGVKIEGRGLYGHYDFEAEARGVCDAVNAEEGWSMTVVPLYAAPQPPRGWLTEEERKCLTFLLDSVCVSRETDECIKALLARETPPRVKVPPAARGETPLVRDLMWGQAIREAGGEVE